MAVNTNQTSSGTQIGASAGAGGGGGSNYSGPTVTVISTSTAGNGQTVSGTRRPGSILLYY